MNELTVMNKAELTARELNGELFSRWTSYIDASPKTIDTYSKDIKQFFIYLQENGLTELAKPSGTRMEACARGQLLILSPWEHHNEQITISRNQCLILNDLARRICEND